MQRQKNELNRLISLLAEKQGVTEKLKTENQLKWVGLMNNIKSQAEDIIYTEIIYAMKKYINTKAKLTYYFKVSFAFIIPQCINGRACIRPFWHLLQYYISLSLFDF